MAPESFDNSGNGPLKVPGFSCSVTYQSSLNGNPEGRFAHGVNEGSFPRLTVRELAMLGLMNAVTDKPNWQAKIFDEAIVERWHDESVAMPLISEQTWAWCLRELREKAQGYDGYVLAYDAANRVVKSDGLVSTDLRAELIAGTRPLLEVEADERDWHPGTDRTVLNLVHPSMYPLVYDRTRVLSQGGRVELGDIFSQMGKGEVAPAFQSAAGPPPSRYSLSRENDKKLWAFSTRFQWLPCEVAFCGEPGTTDVHITSYINNLHPENKGLYSTIEKLISRAIPLWNDVLIKGYHGRSPRRITTYGPRYDTKLPDWIQMSNIPKSTEADGFDAYWEKVQAFLMQPERPRDSDEEDEEDDSNEDEINENETETERHSRRAKRLLTHLEEISRQEDANDRIFPYSIIAAIEDKWMRVRRVIHPEPGAAMTYEDWKAGIIKADVKGNAWAQMDADRPEMAFSPYSISLQDEFRDRGLQVIVKIASIELTPEKPDYPGGGWHLEGMLNEHIVATALFYYDVENVTPARLAFRFEANLDHMSLVYEQDQHQPLQAIFGTNNMRDEPAAQELGSVLTAPVGSNEENEDNEDGTGCRVLAFPNTLQHRVGPFGLADRSRPGHRRFVALWLVDPHYRICSTANVPPQRHDWWADNSIGALGRATPRLPPEILSIVAEELKQYSMDRAEAEALRLDLMAERTTLMPQVERNFGMYNLCEH